MTSTSTPIETPKKDLIYATVQHFEVMYTTEVQKAPKNRVWHDGLLTLHLLNGRIQLSNLKDQKLVESWFHTLPQRPNAPRSIPKELQKPIPLSYRDGNRNQRQPLLEDGLEFEMGENHIVEIVTFKRVSKVDVTFLVEPRLNRKSSDTPSSSTSSPASRAQNVNNNTTPAPTSNSKGRFKTPGNNAIRAMPMRAPSDPSTSSIVAESSFNTTKHNTANAANSTINTTNPTNSDNTPDRRAQLPPFRTLIKQNNDDSSTPSRLASSAGGGGNLPSNKKPRLSGGLRLGLGRIPSSSIIRPSEEAMKRALEMERECERAHVANNGKNNGNGGVR